MIPATIRSTKTVMNSNIYCFGRKVLCATHRFLLLLTVSILFGHVDGFVRRLHSFLINIILHIILVHCTVVGALAATAAAAG